MANKNNYKGKPKNKDSKYYSKDKREETEDRGDGDKYKGKKGRKYSSSNDVAWYAANDQILRDAASLSFFNPVGTHYSINAENTVQSYHDWENTSIVLKQGMRANSVPGVMAINCSPIPGISEDATSPMNVAIRAYYSFIRHANSGSKNYESSDLGMYFMAVDSAVCLYAFAVRLYGTLRMYDQANKYMPDALLAAQNIDVSDFRSHIADFRASLNRWILKLSTLFVPNSMPLYTRHAWMFSNYYFDDPTLKSQIMFYGLEGIWKYIPESGECSYIGLSKDWINPLKYEDLMDILDEVIDVLVSDEDIGIMGGDILKAYGPEGLLKYATVPDDFIVLPSYNEEVLYQMNHATICGRFINQEVLAAGDTKMNAIYQKNNVLLFQPICWHDAVQDGEADKEVALWAINRCSRFMNFKKPSVEPKDIMVSSRLMICGEPMTANFVPTVPGWSPNLYLIGFKPTMAGSEICHSVWIGFYDYSEGIENPLKIEKFEHPCVSSNVDPNGTLVQRMAMYSQFDWAPMLYNVDYSTQTDFTTINGVFANLANYTVIGMNTLSKLHNCALISEFNVPRLGLGN